MKKRLDFVVIYFWLFLLLCAGLGTLIFADREERVSESEKRMLAALPDTFAESVFSGEFSSGFESFLSDGIFLRDSVAGASKAALGLFSAASYEVLKGENSALETETKILYTVKVPVETDEKTNAVDVTKESFNVYISGIDVEGDISTVSRTDVNMIATVNPVTHQVLLTSIPRDYYVNLPSKGAKDKLTHSGLYGIQETIGAVEDIMGIDINYYVRVNYTTAVKLVDAIGGIEVDSPYAFTTSGMQNLNGYHFVKGINKLDGKAALAFCRERHSFVNGDMQRNENQQLVMEGILKKATSSTTILTSYTSILDAVRGNMETDMSAGEMSSLIKMQLDGMPGWDIRKQAIKGANGWGLCYALGFSAAIVEQDPEENARAVDNIVKIMTDEEDSESDEDTAE